MKPQLTVEAEYTDTFGGEPNYCWVKRAYLWVDGNASDLAITRLIKREFGLNGVRGRVDSFNGDSFTFRPYRSCTILMWTVTA